MLRAILFVVALGSGAVSAWLVAATPEREPVVVGPVEPAVTVQMEKVLVAARDVQQGMQVTAEHLRWQPWPGEALNLSFISQTARPEAIEELTGQVLKSNMVAGEPVFLQKLAPKGSSHLSAMLAPGMRAVAIPISAEQGAGGFILPNDRVDVMLTVACRPEDGCGNSMTVRSILQNVRVLAIDQGTGLGDAAASVLVGKTATLELDPAQASTVIGADASGMLSLVLRSAADHEEAAAPQARPQDTVRIWRKGVGEFVTIN